MAETQTESSVAGDSSRDRGRGVRTAPLPPVLAKSVPIAQRKRQRLDRVLDKIASQVAVFSGHGKPFESATDVFQLATQASHHRRKKLPLRATYPGPKNLGLSGRKYGGIHINRYCKFGHDSPHSISSERSPLSPNSAEDEDTLRTDTSTPRGQSTVCLTPGSNNSAPGYHCKKCFPTTFQDHMESSDCHRHMHTSSPGLPPSPLSPATPNTPLLASQGLIPTRICRVGTTQPLFPGVSSLSSAGTPKSSVACVCPVCGQMFALHDRLAKHMASRHKSKSRSSLEAAVTRAYLCDICHRPFARSDMLTRHMRLHTGLKPYTCRVCGQVFSRSDHLSTHQRTHTGEKPYRCPQCPYAACRRDMITRHLRTHTRGEAGSGGGSTPSVNFQNTDTGPLEDLSSTTVQLALPPTGRSRGRRTRNRASEMLARSLSAEDVPFQDHSDISFQTPSPR
nr:EOG090X0G73 [Lepidurus arcticus]